MSLTAARMSYAAALCASVTFGLYVAIAGYTAYKIICSPPRHRASKRVLLAYVALTFIVQTVYYVVGSKWSEIEFVESTEDPGLFASELSSQLALTKNTTYTIAIWLADAFILYRAVAIYVDMLYMAILPALLYIASVATGIGLLIETAKPGSMFGQVAVIDFGTPFWSLSVSMNVLTTLLIAGRLIHRRQAYMESISRTNPSAYGAEIGIFLESAALYAIFAIIYIPMFAKNIPLQFPFSALLVSAASISPHLIILRMVNGESSKLEASLIPLRTYGDRETGIQSTSRASKDAGDVPSSKSLDRGSSTNHS